MSTCISLLTQYATVRTEHRILQGRLVKLARFIYVLTLSMLLYIEVKENHR